MKKNILFISLVLAFSSCTINRHTVGSGPVGAQPDQKIVYYKAKHVYAVYGIFSLNEPILNIPKDSNYQYQASSNIIDGIITSMSGGLITTRTEKIYIKK
jgi:hypothetical protein